VNVGDLWVRISVRMDELRQGLSDAEAQIKATEKRFEGFQAIGDRLSGMGQSLTMGVTLPIVGIATAATHTAMTFNAAMADVATLIPGNTQRVEELKTAVQDMAIETGRRTGDLARGLYQVISAFGDTADTANILEINTRAAATGMATTEEAIALTSAVTKGYGDTSAEAVAKAGDLALLTVRLGQTTFPELAGSIGRVTPLASAMGVSMEDLFATMATLTGVTGSAAEVSTQLRGVLQGLMDPSKEMQAALAAMGYESGTLALESLGLQGVLQGLAAQTGGNKEQLAGLWGQVEAGVGVLALTGGQADIFSQRLLDMQGYAGTTDEAFAEVTEGVNEAGFTWQQMITALEVAGQTIGDILLPTLGSLMEILIPLLKRFADMDDETKRLIIIVGGLAAAVGPLLMGLGFLFMAVGQIATGVATMKSALAKAKVFFLGNATKAGLLAKVMLGLKAVFAVLLGPIGLIIAAVAAVAAGAYFLVKHWETVKAFFLGLWEGVKTFFVNMGAGIAAWVEDTVQWFASLPQRIGEYLTELATQTIPYWIGFGIGTMLRLVIEGITGAIEWFKTLPERISAFLETLKTGVVTHFTTMRERMIFLVSNAITETLRFFSELPGRVWGFIVQLPGRIMQISTTLASTMGGIATAAVNAFMGIVSGLGSLVWDSLMNLRDTISRAARNLARAARDAANALWEGFKKGLGISSPSYLEEAMGRIMDTSHDLLKTLRTDFGAMARIPVPELSPNLAYGAAVMPQAAVAGAAMAAPGISAYHGPLFTVQNMTVRSDDDIQKISRLLQRDIQAGIRARGGR